MKGIYKGINKYISHIFVVKQREIEIGYPTDVKHVAHIGWEGGSATNPSWMTEFKMGPEFSAPSAAGTSMPNAPLSPHGIDVSVPTNGACKWPQSDVQIKGLQGNPQEPKKHRRKKVKATSPRGTSSSTRTHRERKSKSRFTNKADTTTNFTDI